MPVLTSAASVGNIGLRVQLCRQPPVLSMTSVYFLALEATISPCKDLDVCGYLLHPFNRSHSSNEGMRTCADVVLLNHMQYDNNDSDHPALLPDQNISTGQS